MNDMTLPSPSLPPLKVAIIHDWLVVFGGAERVLAQFLDLFPDADVYATVYDVPPEQASFLRGKTPRTTFIQKLPFGKTKYRTYLPLMPLAIEQLDMSGYDLVISSSYCVAKGVLTGPDQKHLSYVHSAARYAWDLQHVYLREARMEKGLKGMLARIMLHYFRMWDVRTSHGVDRYLANSDFVARRIRKIYGYEAKIVYPPAEIDRFSLGTGKDDFYLTASRMVPYKMIPLIAEAFASMPDRKLVIIGDGPEMAKVRAKAGPNVEILGYQSEQVMIDHMQRAKAFVFAAEEDFGIVPLEAQACGTPVIAYGRGGALETVRGLDAPAPTGLFFNQQTVPAIVDAVARFEAASDRFTQENCRKNALRFSPKSFKEAIMAEVSALLDRPELLPSLTKSA
ncbi:glycosyltransferase family 4 protein [Novosphingobium sp. FKTRR1]|uniref:glycosyltransferase family 4 protein n=1 Tax=Novosphingobium sp. FKTRR1 TaxID=2879118 RepID=UPI001CF05755|nr:glycosyltransferase family 4 protein [Novosphingobium sp. FKTRR1]